jgi:autophagy-related protein 18
MSPSQSTSQFSEEVGRSKEPITFLSFNSDRSHILICHSSGVLVLSSRSCQRLAFLDTSPNIPICADVCRNSALVLVAFKGNCFQLWNSRCLKPVSPITTIDTLICGVKVNPKRITILTISSVLIFDLWSLDLFLSLPRGDSVPSTSLGVCASTVDGYFAFTTGNGGVQVIDTYTLFRMPRVKAHDSCVTAIEMTNTLLITASEKGTVIRVFRLPSLELIGLFRRGRTESPIKSILLSMDSKFLTVTGESDTAHLFRLADLEIETYDKTIRPSVVLHSVWQFFPKQYKEAIEAVRDFAFIRLRKETTNFRYIACVVGPGKRSSSVSTVVVSEETGYAFVYDVSIPKGGEGRLTGEYALLSCGEKRGRPVTLDGIITPSTVEESPSECVQAPSLYMESRSENIDADKLSIPTTLKSDALGEVLSIEYDGTDPTIPKRKKKKKKKKQDSLQNFDSGNEITV